MKTIMLVTAAAMLLACATIKSSVGGPLVVMVIALLAMWAVGLYEAWSEKRGLLGWIVSIVLSFIGGIAGVALGSTAMDTFLSLVHFQGSPANSSSPLLYILTVAMAILTVIGSWGVLHAVRRFRFADPRPSV